jgi:predicted RNase H-like HicB family nuclease
MKQTHTLSNEPGAVHPDLEGCSAYGDIPEEAVAEVGIAKQARLEAVGRPVPLPPHALP